MAKKKKKAAAKRKKAAPKRKKAAPKRKNAATKKKKKDGRGMHPHDEIKPMSGTNTITINPEDESSKYKRGY